MTYHLGVDLGTTYTAAAIARDGRVEPATLGHGTTVPSVVFLDGSDGVVIGPAAQLRGSTDPSRVVREFKRRVGDPVPILVGDSPVSAERLMATVLGWVVTEVATAEGEPPATLVVTHPANWGAYKRDLLRHAIRAVPLRVDQLVAEPVAAATSYATRRRLPLGTAVAVYDLGGGTFDAAVVRSEPDGFRIVGQPDGVERLGGIDFDHAVLRHVARAAGLDLDALDPDADPALTLAVTRLREECVAAKEALSTESEVAVPLTLPHSYTEVRLTRGDLEAMVRPALDETIVALRRSIASAHLTPADISAVLLVGGSSRIPLVARLVTAELGRPVAVDARPKDATSLGAALLAGQVASRAAAPPPAPPSSPAPSPGGVAPSPGGVAPSAGGTVPGAGPPPHAAPGPGPVAGRGPRPRRHRPLPAAALAGLVLVGVLAGVLVGWRVMLAGTGGEERDAGTEVAGTGTTAPGAAVDVAGPPSSPIGTGLDHACALAPVDGATAGPVTCWGGDDSDQASPSPGELATIDAGSEVTCGIRWDDRAANQYEKPAGHVDCWGRDTMGQASPPPQPRFFHLSVGDDHGCALGAPEADAGAQRPEGGARPGTLFCWGRDDQGQITVPESTELDGVPVPIGDRYVDVSAGGAHTCGLNLVPGEGGLAVCWGSDAFGQASPPALDPGSGPPPFAGLSAGFRHTCGVHTDGTVTCWGDDQYGQSSPPGERFRAISAGGGFTCGIRTDGTVTCWGVEELREVPPGEFTSISSGDHTACGVRADDTIACWGYGPAATGPTDIPR
jgi:actin-like ATPase involved in cell morphogenesis